MTDAEEKTAAPGERKRAKLSKRAESNVRRRRYDQACAHYSKLIRHTDTGADPSALSALLLNYGRALLRAGRSIDAVVTLRRARTLTPESSDVWFELAIGLSRQKQMQPATEAFRRAAELSPQSASHRSRLALQLKLCGRLDEARQVYAQALVIDPANKEALAALADPEEPPATT